MNNSNNNINMNNMNVKPRMILKKSDIYQPGVGIITAPAPLNNNAEIIKNLHKEMKMKDDKIILLEKMLNREKNGRDRKMDRKHKNNIYFNIVFKILHKILNYNNVKEYSLYGSFVENLLSDKKIEDTILNIFIKDHENMEEYYGLLEILYNDRMILNVDDFDNLCYYSLGDQNIPFWNLEIKLNNYNKKIYLRIHAYDYMRPVNNSASNIEINQSGINHIYRMEREDMDSNISGLNILKILQNTMRSETKMYRNKDINKNLVENQVELFNLLSSQNEYVNNKWSIIGNGFHCIKEDCSVCLEKKIVFELECHHFFCIDCLHSHINNDSYVNKKCPLCRRHIKLH
jgi:hypothetical protein